jgi:hypothetical protein
MAIIGKKQSKEHIEKRIASRRSPTGKGYKMSDAQKKKLSIYHKGRPTPWMENRYISPETRQRMVDSHKGKFNELGSNWQGGKSYEKYTVDWTRSLKIAIRERDKYACQMCGDRQEDVLFDIHHIDYDKKNCNTDNLITLCRACHMKTNGNREFYRVALRV